MSTAILDICKRFTRQKYFVYASAILYPAIGLVLKDASVPLFSLYYCTKHFVTGYKYYRACGHNLTYEPNVTEKYFSIRKGKLLLHSEGGIFKLRLPIQKLPPTYFMTLNDDVPKELKNIIHSIMHIRKKRTQLLTSTTVFSSLLFTSVANVLYGDMQMFTFLTSLSVSSAFVFPLYSSDLNEQLDKLKKYIKDDDKLFLLFTKKYVYVDLIGSIVNTNMMPLSTSSIKMY